MVAGPFQFRFAYIPCLNDRPCIVFIQLLHRLTLQILEILWHVFQVELVAQVFVNFVGLEHLQWLVLRLHPLQQIDPVALCLVPLSLDPEVGQVLPLVDPVAYGSLDA